MCEKKFQLPYITQSHYQDIVEERAVSKLCGYSLCGRRIPEMPKKQYYISTKSNKVYDITDRKVSIHFLPLFYLLSIGTILFVELLQ